MIEEEEERNLDKEILLTTGGEYGADSRNNRLTMQSFNACDSIKIVDENYANAQNDTVRCIHVSQSIENTVSPKSST